MQSNPEDVHTASYIYYPHGALLINGIPGGIPGGKGHAELERDGTVYSFLPPKELTAILANIFIPLLTIISIRINLS